MAGSQIEIVANQIEAQRLGYQAISLTHYDDNLEPQICAGSVCEIGGALFEFPALESITGWSGIAVRSDVYIKLTVAGTSVTASFTTTAPTWDTAKQGWYSGAERYVFYLYKNASGNYTQKALLGSAVSRQLDRLTSSLLLLQDSWRSLDGATQFWAANTEKLHALTAYTKQKEIIAPFGGIINVYFELCVSSTGTAYGRIYKNDVAHGTERNTGSSVYQAYSEALSFSMGDRISLWTKIVSGVSVKCRNLRTRCDRSLLGTIYSCWNMTVLD